MNDDIRLSTTFFRHTKTIKLKRRLGWEGVICLQKLWLWARENKPDGIIGNAEDIEIASEWEGEQNKFFDALLEVGFIVKQNSGKVSLKNWAKRNPWAMGAVTRSLKAKKGGCAKHGKKCEDCQDDCPNSAQSCSKQIQAPAPSPSLSPSPSPSLTPTDSNKALISLKKNELEKKEDIPFKEIIDHLNYTTQARKGFDPTAESNKRLIRARWNKGATFEDFIYVHNIKTAEWKGGDMEKHLVPKTLYRASNFEAYLNQKPKQTQVSDNLAKSVPAITAFLNRDKEGEDERD